MSEIDIANMFNHKGKTTKLIGETRAQAYSEKYQHLTKLQEKDELPYDGNYLGDNELAQNIYQKKYFLKDLDNNLIEKILKTFLKDLLLFWQQQNYQNLNKNNGLKNFIQNSMKEDLFLVVEF